MSRRVPSRTSNQTQKSSLTTSSKGGPKKRYTVEEMEQMEEQLAQVWKSYGRDKEVGRDLYKMYGRQHKPKVDVPTPKTEPWDYRQAGLKEKKPCPQMTKIEYPKVTTKQDILRAKMAARFTKLDLIPKRKTMNEILGDIELLKKERAAFIPQNRGVNRKDMISTLQDKFKYAQDKNLPKLSQEEEMKIQLAVEAQMRRVSKKNYFGAHGLVDPQQEGPEPVPQGDFESQELADLNALFDEVIGEIEERQKYLAETEGLDMKDTRETVKTEILTRVAELQKINAMIKEEKARVKPGHQ